MIAIGRGDAAGVSWAVLVILLGGLAVRAPAARAQTVTPGNGGGSAGFCAQNPALNQFACASGSTATGNVSVAYGMGSTATAGTSTAVGVNSKATGNGSSAFGVAASASGAASTAVGISSTASAAGSVALGAGSVADQANTVSVGSAGGERRITNLAAGVSQTDAVNVGQLSGLGGGFQNQLVGLQNQLGGLQNQVTDNLREARGGVALALAAGGLKFDDRPGKWSIAGAYGNFKGEGGVAFGLGYAATDRLRFNATISGAPQQGSVGGVVSGSFTLN